MNDKVIMHASGREHDLKKEFDAELKELGTYPITENEFKYLDTQGILRQRLRGEIGSRGVAVILHQMRLAVSPPKQTERRHRGGEVTPVRERAISTLVALRASKEKAVVSFRRKALGDRLLTTDQVGKWIHSRAASEGPHTVLLMVPKPSNADLNFRHAKHGLTIFPAMPFEITRSWPAVATWVHELAYPVGDGGRCVPVVAGGILDRLRMLSEKLAARYGWRQRDATVFVLTNTAPNVPSFKVQWEEKDIPTLNRVTVTIDLALTPREVALRYREERKQLLASRHRSINNKHTTLALFTASRRPASLDSMNAWNRKYPKWKYANVTNFGRDTTRARRHLLGTSSERGKQDPKVEG